MAGLFGKNLMAHRRIGRGTARADCHPSTVRLGSWAKIVTEFGKDLAALNRSFETLGSKIPTTKKKSRHQDMHALLNARPIARMPT
jgi:hypothetical protein